MPDKNNNNKKRPNTLLIYLVVFFLAIIAVSILKDGAGNSNATEIEFSEFVNHLQNQDVVSIKISEGSKSYEATLKSGKVVKAYAPTSYDMAVISETYLIPQSAQGLKIETIQPSALNALLAWLPSLLMIASIIFLFVMMTRGGGNAGVMNFGKNKARMIDDADKKVTFDDVAGLDEEKAELAEIVDFLKNPEKYMELGARIPKGVLLVGPPGTGKTFVSKAVAGEAGVPFFSISGSDFVEMFVGVGASRVRELFQDAKRNAPCIVFIDEIDAVGRRRGAGIGGGNDEREQTLNQLLVEMDGFGQNEGIIVIAATNRPDVLDPAILRPGRFDRQIVINTPDVKGREEVFKVHAKGKPISSEVDLKILAKRTPGFTPADIENVMNEAALLAARRNGSKIHMDDIEEAITRVIAGTEKKGRVISDKEKKLTAYHEAGHAIVARSIPGSDPVHQVTIIPRGMAGGFTLTLPNEDRWYTTKTDMKNELMHLLGGRIAEALVLGDISTGASNDLERATKTAHDMVTKYGMSEKIGPINFSDSDEVFLGRDFTSKQNYSEVLAAKIDDEVRAIIDEAYANAEKIVKDHMAELERVAQGLLELETIDGEQFEALYTGSKTLEALVQEEEQKRTAIKLSNEIEAKEAEERRAEAKKIVDEISNGMKSGKRVALIDENGKLIVVSEEEALRRKAEEEALRKKAQEEEKK